MPKPPFTEEKLKIAFGENLRRIRKSKKLTLQDMEDITNIHYNQIGRIERGEITTSIYNVFILAHALKIEPRKLIEIEL